MAEAANALLLQKGKTRLHRTGVSAPGAPAGLAAGQAGGKGWDGDRRGNVVGS